MQGIMFTKELFPSVVNGSKTETRRELKPQPVLGSGDQGLVRVGKKHLKAMCWSGLGEGSWVCAKPRYKPGEVVYLKEPWAVLHDEIPTGDTETIVFYRFDYETPGWAEESKWRNKMFMPAWAARHFVRITEVRCEGLKAIRHYDAIAEGVNLNAPYTYNDYGTGSVAVDQFAALWDAIAKPGFKWSDNPWVWVYVFERCSREGNTP